MIAQWDGTYEGAKKLGARLCIKVRMLQSLNDDSVFLELPFGATGFMRPSDWVVRAPRENVWNVIEDKIIKTILQEAPASTWRDKLAVEKARLGRALTTDEMMTLAKTHNMTPEEIEAQRQSWTRQDKD